MMDDENNPGANGGPPRAPAPAPPEEEIIPGLWLPTLSQAQYKDTIHNFPLLEPGPEHLQQEQD
jgi:hypothetical protein